MSDEVDRSFSFSSLSRQGILFILSAPSGAGKTTLSQRLLDAVPDLRLSISYTTRTPRPGEINGREYHFITEECFTQMRGADAFVEWARVHEALYGTTRAQLDEALARGQDLLLDIDVQGARQIKQRYADTVAVFVLPPSWRDLESRLRGRGTEGEEVIARRLQQAHEEARALHKYDYWIINNQLDQASTVLRAIVEAERARVSRLRPLPQALDLCAVAPGGQGEVG
jgi:guanylate kinase